MARPRQKLDEHQEADAVARRLKKELPGWRRERLLAVQLGMEGELGLDEIAGAVGRARSTIQEWFARFRGGGLERLLSDGRAGNPGAEGLLHGKALEELHAGLAQGAWRTAPLDQALAAQDA